MSQMPSAFDSLPDQPAPEPLPALSLLDEIIQATERARADSVDTTKVVRQYYPVTSPCPATFGAFMSHQIITCRASDPKPIHGLNALSPDQQAYPVTYPCPSTFGAAMPAAA